MPYVEEISTVYAKALAEAAAEKGGLDLLQEVGARVGALGKSWRANGTLRAYFLSAKVPAATKRASLDRVVAEWPKLAGNFLKLLQVRGRLPLVPGIADALSAIVDQAMGRVRVTLTTAAPIPEDQVGRWTDLIRGALGKEPILRHVVKPELIAGAIVRAGDVVADGSARRRLNELKNRIIQRGKHALQS